MVGFALKFAVYERFDQLTDRHDETNNRFSYANAPNEAEFAVLQ